MASVGAQVEPALVLPVPMTRRMMRMHGWLLPPPQQRQWQLRMEVVQQQRQQQLQR
jgi:hypothetical protein